jgi:RNA polymerase-binding transcription factor DksA
MNRYDRSMAFAFDRILAKREEQLCVVLNAREESMISVSEAQAERAALQLEQVLSARGRLRNNSYGACVDCGKSVDMPRLIAMPETLYCASCQLVREEERAPLLH